MYDYQENYSRHAAAREKAVYDKLLEQYDALLKASIEGVFEITVRSQSGAIRVPVSLNDGIELTNNLIEAFTGRIDMVERHLNVSLAELGSETELEMKREKEREQEREATIRRNQEAYAAEIQQSLNDYNRLLARDAATSATPIQKGPGRPRKVRLQPELVGEVAGMAAGVPMNSGTALAAGRATNLPQG
jgi:hypothetical protein